MLGAVIAGVALVFAVAAPASAAETDDIYAGLNAERASAALPGLAHNVSLDSVALAWANQMAANNAMSHNPSTGSQIPSGYTGWGENVATGFPTGSATNAGWTASPGHYANMIGDFTDVGIAFVAAGGTTWAVEVFAKYGGTATTSTATTTTAATTSTAVATTPIAAETAPAAPATAPTTAAAATPAPAATAVPASAAPVPAATAAAPAATTAANTGSDVRATGESSATLSTQSSTQPTAQPVAITGLIGLPVVAALILFLVWRARRAARAR